MVSILVLLDFVLKVLWTRTNISKRGVSILVLLDFVLKDEIAEFMGDLLGMFQSLFYWILFLRTVLLTSTALAEPGFNPCFIGFCS